MEVHAAYGDRSVLYWDSVTGRNYKIYGANQFEGVWTNILVVPGNGNEMGFTNAPGPNPGRYLRLEVQPAD